MGHDATAKLKAALDEDDASGLPLPDVRRLFRKSALLNIGIFASALMIAAGVGQRGTTAVAVLALMMSMLIWIATFLTWLLVVVVNGVHRYGRLLSRRPRPALALASTLADDWLDGPGAQR